MSIPKEHQKTIDAIRNAIDKSINDLYDLEYDLKDVQHGDEVSAVISKMVDANAILSHIK